MIQHEWITDEWGTFDLTNVHGATAEDRVFLSDKGIEGMGNPPISRFGDESPQLDGRVDTGWRARPRQVFWPIVIDSNPDIVPWQQQQALWWKTMRPNLIGTWRVTAPDATYRDLLVRYESDGGAVYPVDPSMSGLEVHGITLVADDPWWRGPVVSRVFQTAETPLDFYAITNDRVFNLMSSNTVSDAFIANPGDVTAWPVFRFDGPITSFEIRQTPPNPFVGSDITSDYDIPAGDWLILDTDPRVQTMTRYFSGGGSLDVTDQISNAAFFGIAAGTPRTIYVTLNGSGSLTASIVPRYFRAF